LPKWGDKLQLPEGMPLKMLAPAVIIMCGFLDLLIANHEC
jgi:hypothetical protein